MSNYKLKVPKVIENTVVNGYKAIEQGVVGTYKKIEKNFVDTFLEEIPDESAENQKIIKSSGRK